MYCAAKGEREQAIRNAGSIYEKHIKELCPEQLSSAFDWLEEMEYRGIQKLREDPLFERSVALKLTSFMLYHIAGLRMEQVQEVVSVLQKRGMKPQIREVMASPEVALLIKSEPIPKHPIEALADELIPFYARKRSPLPRRGRSCCTSRTCLVSSSSRSFGARHTWSTR